MLTFLKKVIMMIDIHAHILPSLDDGPRTFQESLEMCRIASEDGIRKMVATPHILNGIYDVKKKDILEKVEILNKLLKDNKIELEVLPGADVHLHEGIIEGLKKDEILTINNGRRYLLLEFPSQIIPVEARQVVFKLQVAGILPIISHPERNFAIQDNPELLTKFIEIGALLQVTAQSVTGEFGSREKKCAHWLLKHNMVHVLATDAHSINARPPILSIAVKKASKLLGEEKSRALVFENPLAIIEGRELRV
ncbi:MAG TPA: tyrosine-protein phosphatase [Candidatus Brocadiia bacterium]|nr:tyrosine protein phosphatase [Planctomycetota bacterium]MDO8093867.1 CpsB/CapC family capsule biosynthesis tyrosine phosphatase [Candidatus Brocadiales bacterium]